MRQDSPHLENRDDHEARALSDSADPQFILNALKDAHKPTWLFTFLSRFLAIVGVLMRKRQPA
jgi:hypothetical protein